MVHVRALAVCCGVLIAVFRSSFDVGGEFGVGLKDGADQAPDLLRASGSKVEIDRLRQNVGIRPSFHQKVTCA